MLSLSTTCICKPCKIFLQAGKQLTNLTNFLNIVSLLDVITDIFYVKKMKCTFFLNFPKSRDHEVISKNVSPKSYNVWCYEIESLILSDFYWRTLVWSWHCTKNDQIRRKLQIWSHFLKKSLIENFNFCSVWRYPNI